MKITSFKIDILAGFHNQGVTVSVNPNNCLPHIYMIRCDWFVES